MEGFETEYDARERRTLWFAHLVFEGDAAVFHGLRKSYRVSLPPDIGTRLHGIYEEGRPLELREVLSAPSIEGVDRAALRELAYQAGREDLGEKDWSAAVIRLAAMASPRAVIAMLDEIERLERIVQDRVEPARSANPTEWLRCALGKALTVDASIKLADAATDTPPKEKDHGN